ncbi:MAG: flavodoxin [Allobaculum sp.]|nr:flavodoxin [Allobaculum sp.]
MSILVVYFSASGVTARAAKRIALQLQAPLFEIQPKIPYTSADLNWMDANSRTSLEVKTSNVPVEIAQWPDLTGITTLFIGFPVWWYSAPKIIDSFLAGLSLKNISIVPFCTSGGTSIQGCEKKLKEAFPQVTWLPGLRISSSTTDAQLQSWINSLHI